MISNNFNFSGMQKCLNSLASEFDLDQLLNSDSLLFDDTGKIIQLARQFLASGGNPNFIINEVSIGDDTFLYPTFFHIVYLYWKRPDIKWNEQTNTYFSEILDRMLNDPRLDLSAKFSEYSLCDGGHFFDSKEYRFLQDEESYFLEGVTIAHYAMVIGDFEMVDKVLEKAPHLLHTTCNLSKGKGLFSKEEYVDPVLNKEELDDEINNGTGNSEKLVKISRLHDDETLSGIIAWGAPDRASFLGGILSPIIRTTKVSLLHLSARLGDEIACGFFRAKNANFAALDSDNRTPFDYFKLSIFESLIPMNQSTKRMISLLKPIPRIHQPHLPLTQLMIKKEGYEIIYDTRTKIAIYAYQRLTKRSFEKNADRKGLSFKVDHEIPAQNRAKHADYINSGFQKGHLVPAADAVSSEKATSDTFFFSNAFPQVPSFNQGYWKSVEKHVRELVNGYDTVEVFTGPLFIPQLDAYGRTRVSYDTIGSGNIAAPSHVFKVLFLHKRNTTSQAFILPNAPIASETPLSQFRVTLEKVQELSGILFSAWRSK